MVEARRAEPLSRPRPDACFNQAFVGSHGPDVGLSDSVRLEVGPSPSISTRSFVQSNVIPMANFYLVNTIVIQAKKKPPVGSDSNVPISNIHRLNPGVLNMRDQVSKALKKFAVFDVSPTLCCNRYIDGLKNWSELKFTFHRERKSIFSR